MRVFWVGSIIEQHIRQLTVKPIPSSRWTWCWRCYALFRIGNLEEVSATMSTERSTSQCSHQTLISSAVRGQESMRACPDPFPCHQYGVKPLSSTRMYSVRSIEVASLKFGHGSGPHNHCGRRFVSKVWINSPLAPHLQFSQNTLHSVEHSSAWLA